MKFSTTRIFPIALMLSLALLTFYLERTVRDDESPAPLRRHDPDYIVTNFTTTTYTGEGAVETVMSAQRMVHYPDDDTTELFVPCMVYAKPEQPRFSVRAAREKSKWQARRLLMASVLYLPALFGLMVLNR